MKKQSFKINKSTLHNLIKESIETNLNSLDNLKTQLKNDFYNDLINLFNEVIKNHGYDEGMCEDYCEEYAYWQAGELANDCIKVINSDNWDVPSSNFRPFGFVMEHDHGIRTKEELLAHEDAPKIINDWFWDCFGSYGIKYNFATALDEWMDEYERESQDEEIPEEEPLNESKLTKLIKESIKKHLNEGTNNQELDNAWVKATEEMGAEGLLDALYHAMSEDDIRENLEYIDRMYELGLFNDFEDDEYENDDDIEL